MSALAVKRRTADRAEWKRVLRKDFHCERRELGGFRGHVATLSLHALTAPLYIDLAGEPLCIADDGYTWVQHFPEGAHHVLTTMWSASGALVQHYIDICRASWLDERGVPCFDDLFLDVSIIPGRTPLLLDVDELAAAHSAGVVTDAEVQLAWREARRVLAEVERGTFGLLAHASTSSRSWARGPG